MKKRWVHRVFTSTSGTSWTAPAGVTCVFARGVGGGGGGGAGVSGGASTVLLTGGGGGGGGALAETVALEVVPGRQYSIAAGQGGQGGVVSGGAGQAGGDSYVFDNTTGETLARWTGAMWGRGGIAGSSTYAGEPIRTDNVYNNWYNALPGLGGWGINPNAGYTRAESGSTSYGGAFASYATPSGGTVGTTAGSYKGGGGGGSGGRSTWATTTGGAGGNGGNGNSAGAGTAGAAGGAGGAPGEGGGGGGGGGCGSSAGGAFGAGGSGANGIVILSWLE